jgi:hypothetical protein
MRPTIFQIENGFNVITKQETELDDGWYFLLAGRYLNGPFETEEDAKFEFNLVLEEV